jgi:hypothetical protein
VWVGDNGVWRVDVPVTEGGGVVDAVADTPAGVFPSVVAVALLHAAVRARSRTNARERRVLIN